MRTNNPENERIKHKYLRFLKGPKKRSTTTLDMVAKALHRFDTFNKFRDFRLFRHEQAESFMEHLFDQRNLRTGEPLSISTIYSTAGVLKAFFQWLGLQPGFRSRNMFSDAEYFSVSEKDARIATARRMPRYPTHDQIIQTVHAMPTITEVERRDQALMAFILLTAARANAAASVQLGDIDIKKEYVQWDARHVLTKNSKTYVTFFFPGIHQSIRKIVVDWVTWLRVEKGWGGSDPVFPATARGDQDWQSPSRVLARTSWKTTASIRKIFEDAFERAKLPYYNPHSFRHTIEQLGEDMCRTDSERKAWSQNLGHAHVRTSFDAYAPMDASRQLETLRSMSTSATSDLNIHGQIRRLADALDRLV